MSILVRRLTLRNYKSIARAIIELSDLTTLVGPNGAGKSNVVDALRFTADSLNTTLDVAMRQRGGLRDVRRRSGGHPNHFAIAFRMRLMDRREASYAFRIGARPNGAFVVQNEQAVLSGDGVDQHYFEVSEGELINASKSLSVAPRGSADRLYLTAVSGVEPFRLLYDALASIGSYNINPAAVRETQPHDSGDRLVRDGANLAAVIKRLSEQEPGTAERVQTFLRRVMPEIEGVEHEAVGPRETLVFRQQMQKLKDPWKFYAASMSDGTLRSLGVLVALFQWGLKERQPAPLVAIEEPEATIHPGAASTLAEAMLEAALSEQVLVTTHSPDLLDHEAFKDSTIYSVEKIGGETIVAPVNDASLSAIRDGLYTPGELLRDGQLQPAPGKLTHAIRQSDLFERLR